MIQLTKKEVKIKGVLILSDEEPMLKVEQDLDYRAVLEHNWFIKTSNNWRYRLAMWLLKRQKHVKKD
jgi:hypothetical protein